MDELLVDKLQFYGKKWFARISLSLAVFMMVPTVAIMATWNTLPGEKLYPTKRYLEGIALKLVGNNFTVRADLQTQFVEQRFSEAETLLSQSSTSGLNDLAQQIQVTKTDIIAARDRAGGKDAVVAQQKAQKLSIQLKEYSQKLEASKQNTTSQGSTTSKTTGVTNTGSTPTATTNVNNQVVVATKAPGVVSPTATPVATSQPVVPPGDVVTIDELQEEIADAIEELKDKKEKNNEKIEELKEKFKNASPEEKVNILKMIEEYKNKD